MASAKPVPRQGDQDSFSDFPNMKGLKPLQGHTLRRGKWETLIKNKIYTLCPAPLPYAKSHEARRVRNGQLLSVLWMVSFGSLFAHSTVHPGIHQCKMHEPSWKQLMYLH